MYPLQPVHLPEQLPVQPSEYYLGPEGAPTGG